jgi:hypothetical protein
MLQLKSICFGALFMFLSTHPASMIDAAITNEIHEFLSNDEIHLVLTAANFNAEGAFDADCWTAGNIPIKLVSRLAAHSPYNFRRSLRSSTSTGESTSLHTDVHGDSCYAQGDNISQKESTFVFMNTNPNAVFVHGGQTVPVTAGKLVNFQADEPHQTVIEDGYVQMLVPFARRRLMPPKGECDNDHSGEPDDPDTLCC